MNEPADLCRVAVVAHSGKTLGGGLVELRKTLAERGIASPAWFEVPKSKRAPAAVQQALSAGPDVVIVWGGDGMVQRSIDALAGQPVDVAIVPAGTANLLATNLGIPQDIGEAVDLALFGRRRRLDVGRVNGERFAVMAGTGFDALMIRDADRRLKDKVGKLAYVTTGWRNLKVEPVGMRIEVDGHRWFEGPATCALFGNVGTILGGITAFDGADPADGRLEIGVVTAEGPLQWARVFTRMAVGRSERSPFVQTTGGERVDLKLSRPMPYELDGGDRKKTDRLKVKVEPGAVSLCVPEDLS